MFRGLILVLALGPAAPRPGIAPGRVAPAPIRLINGHRLTQQADGSWLFIDRARGFNATIAPDGQLSFGGIHYPTEGNQAWSTRDRDPLSEWRNTYPAASNDINSGSNSSGAVAAIISGLVWGAIAVRGDHRQGQHTPANQPLAARERFALDTVEFRTQLAATWYAARLQDALDELDVDLRALWSDAIQARTRRAAVFALWNGFERSLPEPPLHPSPAARTELERQRADMGVMGREAVYEFIRTYLRQGTREAYGRLELRRLNERRTRLDPFDPYGYEAPSP